MHNSRNWQPASEAMFFHPIQTTSPGRGCGTSFPNSRTAKCGWVCQRCCIQPKVLQDASSHKSLIDLVCWGCFSQHLCRCVSPLMPPPAFWPLFGTDFCVVAVQCRDRLCNGSKCATQSSQQPGALWSTSGIWHLPTQLKNWWSGYWTCSVLCQHVSIPLFLTRKSNISFFSTTRGSLSNWHIWQPHCTSKNFTGLLAVAGIFTKLYF